MAGGEIPSDDGNLERDRDTLSLSERNAVWHSSGAPCERRDKPRGSVDMPVCTTHTPNSPPKPDHPDVLSHQLCFFFVSAPKRLFLGKTSNMCCPMLLLLLLLLLLLSVMAVKTIYNSTGSTLVVLRASYEDRNFPLEWPCSAIMTQLVPELFTDCFFVQYLFVFIKCWQSTCCHSYELQNSKSSKLLIFILSNYTLLYINKPKLAYSYCPLYRVRAGCQTHSVGPKRQTARPKTSSRSEQWTFSFKITTWSFNLNIEQSKV